MRIFITGATGWITRGAAATKAPVSVITSAGRAGGRSRNRRTASSRPAWASSDSAHAAAITLDAAAPLASGDRNALRKGRCSPVLPTSEKPSALPAPSVWLAGPLIETGSAGRRITA